MSTQDIINQLRKAIPQSIAEEIVGVQPMGRAVPDTWQSYLRRLGNGINGVSERSKTLTEKDIIANAEIGRLARWITMNSILSMT